MSRERNFNRTNNLEALREIKQTLDLEPANAWDSLSLDQRDGIIHLSKITDPVLSLKWSELTTSQQKRITKSIKTFSKITEQVINYRYPETRMKF